MPLVNLTNLARAERGANTADGLVMLAAGETRELDMPDGELADLPDYFSLGETAPASVAASDAGDGLDDKAVGELDKIIAAEGVKVPDQGTGGGGRIVKADKVAAIRAARQKPADDGLGDMDDETLRATVQAITGAEPAADADRETLLGLARAG